MSGALSVPFGITLSSCWEGLADPNPDAVLGKLLYADMAPDAPCGAIVQGSGLPAVLSGTEGAVALLQVEEYQDSSLPLRDAAKGVAAGGRGWSTGPKRILNLVVTDGLQRLRAVELSRCPSLDAICPGCKLVVRPPLQSHHGVLLLQPHTVACVGGEVAYLSQREAEFWKAAMISVVGKPYLAQSLPPSQPPAPGISPAPSTAPGPPAGAGVPQHAQHAQHPQHPQYPQHPQPSDTTPVARRQNVLSLESPG